LALIVTGAMMSPPIDVGVEDDPPLEAPAHAESPTVPTATSVAAAMILEKLTGSVCHRGHAPPGHDPATVRRRITVR
jgi:hypothetical protein